MGLGSDLGKALGAAAKSFIQDGPLASRRVPWVDEWGNFQLSNTFVTEVMGLSPAQMWRKQPHLRTVVSFLARNVAQLGVHSFDRVSDVERQRLTDDVSARLFRQPNPYDTRYDLMYALISDVALYDDAYWWVTKADSPSGWQILPIRTSWIQGTEGGNAYGPETYNVQGPSGKLVKIPAEQVIHFKGWDPIKATGGTTPVVTLKEILLEQIHALVFRNQMWKRGGRVGSVITRPPGHTWTESQELRFLTAFRQAYQGDDGTSAGGVPILQDGMTMARVGFNAKEDQFVEGTKLALTTVAAVYHVNPTMVGLLDAANYSNMVVFRQMLYGDTLGPVTTMIQDRVNAFLLPMIGATPNSYIELNIQEKLKGSFEEQAEIMSTAIGGPWMLRNEGRARVNLPPIEGGDELIVPLNVTEGGQASPQDGKAAAPQRKQLELETADPMQALRKFFARQESAVKSAKGAGTRKASRLGDPDWWDGERWDRELTEVFKTGGVEPALAKQRATETNQATMRRLMVEG